MRRKILLTFSAVLPCLIISLGLSNVGREEFSSL